MSYRPEIDGLRALAVAAVILFHAGFSAFQGGFVGVDIFFVISGFLITSIIVKDIERGRFTLARFYERRARRILPALFFVVLCCIPFGWLWMMPKDVRDFASSVISVPVFGSNILFWKESGYFDTSSALKPLLHTWSLAVEEQYYIFFPIALVLLWRYARKNVIWAIGLIGLLSFVLSLQQSESFSFYWAPTRAWELMAGALCSFVTVAPHRARDNLLSAIGLCALVASVFAGPRFPSVYSLAPVVGTCLILVFGTMGTAVGSLLAVRPLVGVGLISYSAYLWHQPLFAFARIRALDDPGIALRLVLAVSVFPLAYLSWRFVETPWRSGSLPILRNRRVLVGASCTSGALLVAVGLAGHVAQGFPDRFDRTADAVSDPPVARLDACSEETERASGVICVIGDPTAVPTIALIGDSHGAQLTGALDEQLRARSLSAVVYVQALCPPLIDMANSRRSPLCRPYMQWAYQDILRRSSVKSVILAAAWAVYTTGWRWGDDEISYYTDAQSAEKSVTENVAVFRRALERTRDALKGRSVMLVKSVPEYEVDVPRAIAKDLVFSGVPALPSSKRVTAADYRVRNAGVERALLAAGSRTWGYMIDPSELFCSGDACQFVSSRLEIFYHDNNHLSLYGARLLVAELMKVLDQQRYSESTAQGHPPEQPPH